MRLARVPDWPGDARIGWVALPFRQEHCSVWIQGCLLRFILAAGDGLGPHGGCPWRCQGLGLGPGLAWGRQNGLDCTPVQAGALFYWDPGIQGMAKVGADLPAPGPTINLTTA